jgi:hypothetical protein
MAVTLYNKTKMDDDVILAFIERADQLLQLSSDIEVKVTQAHNNIKPGAYFRDRPTANHECLIHLRIPPFVSNWDAIPTHEVDAWCRRAADWFELVVRHEFTHGWQRENLPHWDEPSFNGRPPGSRRRRNWGQRPVEIDCEARQDNILAEPGSEDEEYVDFLKEYFIHELRTH